MSKFTHNERSDIYTAERSDIYTAERSDIYTAERSDIYSAERSDIYTNPDDDGTVGTTASNRLRHDPPNRNRYHFDDDESKKASADPYRPKSTMDREDLFDVESESALSQKNRKTCKQEPNDDWNLATQQKRAATAPSSTPPVSTHSPVQDYGPQFVPVVCVDDSGVTHAPPISTVTNGEHGRPTAKAELEDVPMMHYLQAKCQKCFGCIIALACAAIVAIVALVVVVLTQSSGSTVAPNGSPTGPSSSVGGAPVHATTLAPTRIDYPTTSSPTSAPTRSRAEAMTEYINSIKLSNGTLAVPEPPVERRRLQSEATPEEKALVYLVYQDPLELSPDGGLAAQFQLRQRYAALTLLVQLDDFAATHVNSSSRSECGWTMVWCSTLSDPPEVDEIRSSTVWDISENISIPPDLGLLSAMTVLDINHATVTGSLPDTIGLWTNLKKFDVHGSLMTGTLPNSIGSWTKLTDFSIAENAFNGPMPASISAWTDAKTFRIDNNQLSGTIPSGLSSLTVLESAHFELNRFNGSMPLCDGDERSSRLDTLSVDCLEVECPCCNTGTECEDGGSRE